MVLADGEFSSIEAIANYTAKQWHYLKRLACDAYVTTADETLWIDELGVQPGDVLWLEEIYLTQAQSFGPVNLLVTWDGKRNQLSPSSSIWTRPTRSSPGMSSVSGLSLSMVIIRSMALTFRLPAFAIPNALLNSFGAICDNRLPRL